MKWLARTAAAAGAGSVVVCVAVLTADDLAARRQAPRDAAAIEALQAKVRMDASAAPRLEAEHQRISRARRARKGRIDGLSLFLIAGVSAFLWGAKKLQPERRATIVYQAKPRAVATARPRVVAADSTAPAAPAIDLSAVDEIVATHGRSRESAIPILQAIQARFRYLPDEALRRVCEITEIPPAQIAGTSSFYSQLRREPTGKHLVRVCHGTACHVSGARQIAEELRRSLGIPEGGETDRDLMFTIDEVACLGCCSLAPVLMVDERTVGRLTPASAREVLEAVEPAVTREPA